MMGGLKFIVDRKNIAKMNRNMPVFLIAGAMDPVGNYGKDVKKVYNLFLEAGMKNVSVKLYEGDRHEILNEDDRQQVYNDVLGWIESLK